jgi:hypothetical protein
VERLVRLLAGPMPGMPASIAKVDIGYRDTHGDHEAILLKGILLLMA